MKTFSCLLLIVLALACSFEHVSAYHHPKNNPMFFCLTASSCFPWRKHSQLTRTGRTSSLGTSSSQPQPIRKKRFKVPFPLPLATVFILPRGGSAVAGAASGISALMEAAVSTKLRCWGFLMVSIIFENLASSLIKLSRVKKSPSILGAAFVLFTLSHAGFYFAVEKIDLGIAYAVWSALGTLILTGVGIAFFGESYDLTKMGCLLLILTGVVGLNLREPH